MDDMKIWKGDRLLRCGFTTGSCAAAAAKAAVWMLLTGEDIRSVEIMTPKGVVFAPEIEQIRRCGQRVSCAVQKDGGDDPDVTNGLYITAAAEIIPGGQVIIDGGEGVGRVTRAGLDQPVGAVAINRVPRRMIEDGIREVLAACGQTCGIRVVISVEGGEERAKKTFNPRLGIVGGISILGTSGVVIPMSEKALTDTIRLDVKAQVAQGNGSVLAVPGNYGIRYCKEMLGIGGEHIVVCSNYIGETVDAAVEYGATGLLLTGHLGKFVKLAAGIMNTHSREADGRMEILASAAIRCGCSAETAAGILECVTTDEAVGVLDRNHLTGAVMGQIITRAQACLQRRAYEKLDIEIIMYSLEAGTLGATEGAGSLLEKIKEYA